MKITYRILWFDNSPELLDSLSGDIDYLKNQIGSWGFIPEVILVCTPDDFFRHTPFDEVDLVVVDFDLEEYGTGQDFIEQVRSKQVFTDVIFYSAQAAEELWEAVKLKKLEGIYVAHKDTIISRILGVCEHSMRKVMDVENMRGIVMAEVGDLDRLLEEIFVTAMKDVPVDKQTEIFSRFHAAANKQVTALQAALASFIQAPSVEELFRLCDSDKRWSNYNRVKKHHQLLKEHEIGDYAAEVLQPRNFLAHGVPQMQADGSLKFIHNNRSYNFDRAEGGVLRMKIIGYKQSFKTILKALSSKS